MADEQENEPVIKKKSKNLLWLTLIFITLMLAGGGGYYAYTASQEPEDYNRPKPPHFMILEPFVITLKSDTRPHYLQLKLSLMSREKSTIDDLEIYRPMIRNEIIRYLGSLRFQDVKQPGASDLIRESALDQLLALFEKEQVEASIEELVITDMVIQ